MLYGQLSLENMTEKERVARIKPLQEAQKIIDDAAAEDRTKRVIKAPRKHRKRVRETDVPSMPQVSEGGSTDSSMQDAGSDSDSESSDSGWDWSSDE